jgi:lipid-binding SYLF domain-containing protein
MLAQALLEEAVATVERLQASHADLKPLFEKSYGYVVFPSLGRASVVLGVTFGRGVVFEQGVPIGIASISELTVGVQVGGQTFSELLFFPTRESLDKLKRGQTTFTANASAVIVKAAASGTSDFSGVIAKAYSHGGMLLELSLGGQNLTFSREPTLGQLSADKQRSKPERREVRESAQQERAASGSEGAEAVHEDSANVVRAGLHAVESASRDAVDRSRAMIEEQGERVTEAAQGSPSRARKLLRRVQRLLPSSLKLRLAPKAARLALATSRVGSRIGGKVGKALAPLAKLEQEQEVSRTLHPEARAALASMLDKDETLRERLERAAGYAIFPSVGKASAVLGATYGRGEVFERGRLIGYAALIQLTIGVQAGGDTFSELVIFDKPEALERFKESKVAFAANAAAVIVKAGGAVTRDSPPGADVYVMTDGGLLLEMALGGQKFVYRKAALTRGKTMELEPASA